MRKPVLKHAQIIRLGRILNMMYKPPELAEEIGVTPDTIYRSYIPAGLPFIREYHSVWIHGPSFVQWARDIVSTQRKAHPGLPDGYAYCLKCNQAVEMINPRIVYTNLYIHIYQSDCPTCERHINRFSKRERGQ